MSNKDRPTKVIQIRWYEYDSGHEPPSGHYSVGCDTMPDAIRAAIEHFELTEEQMNYLNNFKKFTAYPRKSTRLHVLGIWCWAGPRGWIGPEW